MIKAIIKKRKLLSILFYSKELNNKVIEYLSSSEISQAEDEKINNNTLYSNNQNNIDQKGKNNTKKFYNIRRKIIRMCITSIELIIKSIYYIYSSDKLTDITIKNQFGKNFQKYQLFFKKKLISIYFGSRPKRFIHIFSNYFFLYNIIYFFENIYLKKVKNIM